MWATDTWLSNVRAAEQLGQETMELINERNQGQRVGSHSSKITSSIRVNLQKFSQLIKDLKDDLMRSSTTHAIWVRDFESFIWCGEMDVHISKEKEECKREGIKKENPSSCTRFPDSLLDAELLVRLSIKKAVLPNVGGKKEFSPESDSDVSKVDEYYEELGTVLSEERVCKRGSLSSGYWDAEKELIIVEQARGTYWQKFGTKLGRVCYALPEEGLFLIEQGVFELFLNQLPLSMQEAWMLLHEHIPSLEYYSTFAFLCRQGFGVLSSRRFQCLSRTERTMKSTGTRDVSAPGGTDKALETATVDVITEKRFAKGINTVDCKHTTHLISNESTLSSSDKCASLAECSETINLPTCRTSTSDFVMERPCLDAPANLENVSAFRNTTSDSEMEEAGLDKTANISKDAEVIRAFCKPDALSMQISTVTKTDPCGTAIELADEPDAATASDINMEVKVPVIDDNTPIVKPTDATSINAILSKLQIIKPRTLSGQNQSAYDEPRTPLGPYLDIYQKGSTFKKSDPGRPDYRVYSRKYTDPPPSQSELEAVMCAAEGIPVKFAICNRGSVTFYAFIETDVSKGL